MLIRPTARLIARSIVVGLANRKRAASGGAYRTKARNTSAPAATHQNGGLGVRRVANIDLERERLKGTSKNSVKFSKE